LGVSLFRVFPLDFDFRKVRIGHGVFVGFVIVLVLLLIIVSFFSCRVVLQELIMSVTRSQTQNRLRKVTAIRHACQIRSHALAMVARGRLSMDEAVIMAVVYFYYQRWNVSTPTADCEEIYNHVMALGALDILAAILANNGGGVAGAA
jgi:hypothetical protein